MTEIDGVSGARRSIAGRVAFWVVALATVLSPFWIRFTPLRSIPMLGFLALFAGWFIYAGFRRSKRGLVGLGAGFSVFVIFGLVTGLLMSPLQTPSLSSSPVELSKIIDISRFRSCAGHDFSGASVGDPGSVETDRSMKHYVTISDTYGGGVEVPVLAVTNGTITKSASIVTGEGSHLESAGDFNGEVTLLADTNALFGNWNVRYQHVHPTRAVGTRVSAGEVIATVPPRDWAQVIETSTGKPALFADQPISFDVAVEYEPLFPTGVRMESYLVLSTASVKDAYDAAGYRLNDAILSRAARDAAPCNGKYNVDASADWINSDRVRQASDDARNGSAQASSGSSSGGSTSSSKSGSARPECTANNLGQTFADASGTWKCQRSVEGNLTWGPASG